MRSLLLLAAVVAVLGGGPQHAAPFRIGKHTLVVTESEGIQSSHSQFIKQFTGTRHARTRRSQVHRSTLAKSLAARHSVVVQHADRSHKVALRTVSETVQLDRYGVPQFDNIVLLAPHSSGSYMWVYDAFYLL
jgi:hypothetical protein